MSIDEIQAHHMCHPLDDLAETRIERHSTSRGSKAEVQMQVQMHVPRLHIHRPPPSTHSWHHCEECFVSSHAKISAGISFGRDSIGVCMPSAIVGNCVVERIMGE